MFKNKTEKIIYFILFGVMLFLFIYLGNKSYNGVEDNVLFANEFKELDEYNVYKYAKARDIYLAMEKDLVVLFGFKSNKWTGYMASLLNSAAKKAKIDEVYYYDFLDDRGNNNGNYELIVNKLDGLVSVNDRGKKELYAPAVLIIKDGKIIYFDDETSFMKGDISPSSYWTKEKSDEKIKIMTDALREYRGVISGTEEE